jgi:hypothetical protein
VQRRAADADVHERPAAERAPGRVQFEAHPDVRVPGPGRVVDHVEVLGRVDHERDRVPGHRVGRQGRERRTVRGRVADHQVTARAGGTQPQRLGQGVAEQARVPGPGQHPPQQETAADGLAGDPDGAAAGAADEIGGVVVEGGQVDDGQRRVEALRRVVVAGPGRRLGHFRTVGQDHRKVKAPRVTVE